MPRAEPSSIGGRPAIAPPGHPNHTGNHPTHSLTLILASKPGRQFLLVSLPLAMPSLMMTERPRCWASSRAGPADCSSRFHVACTLSNSGWPLGVLTCMACRRVSACCTPAAVVARHGSFEALAGEQMCRQAGAIAAAGGASSEAMWAAAWQRCTAKRTGPSARCAGSWSRTACMHAASRCDPRRCRHHLQKQRPIHQ